MERTKIEVRIGGKVDLDTVGVGFIFGVDRNDNVIVLRNGQASEDELADDQIFCIEVGGSGRIVESNFDHHDPGGPKESATMQAFKTAFQGESITELSIEFRISTYIDILDTMGAKSLPSYGQVEFPTLSDVFAGMCLMTRDSMEQFHRGIEILERIFSEEQDPFGTIVGFPEYAAAKAENNRQIAIAAKNTQWSMTDSGRKLGYLVTDFYGAPGVLYGMGAEIVVAYAPQFGNPPVPKFTVAGNGIRVDAALERLNALEPGWGGPATGTIIGSPREGSKLSIAQVVEIVREVL